MVKIIKHEYVMMTVLITVLTLFVSIGCSQSTVEIAELSKAIAKSEEKIKALESEINLLTEQNANLTLELDSIGVPTKIKHIKGYQGNVEISEDTTFKLMPTGSSNTLATLKAGTVVEALALAEITTYDPC